jgi:hypothetical protein
LRPATSASWASLISWLLFGHFKELNRLLALNAREGMQEPVERVASFDEIEEGLDWYTGSSEARGAVHDLFVNGDDAGQGRPFLRSHIFKVGDLS